MLPLFDLKIQLNIQVTFGGLCSLASGQCDGPTIRQSAVLAQQMQDVYTLSELRMVSRLLGVEFENLSGDTLFDKAYGLIVALRNSGEALTLLEYLEKNRPSVQWRNLISDKCL